MRKTSKEMWAQPKYRKRFLENIARINSDPEKLKQQSELMKELNAVGKLNSAEHREKTRQRNLTNNPSWIPGAMKKAAETQRAQGDYKRASQRMAAHNPMKDAAAQKAMVRAKIVNVARKAVKDHGDLDQSTYEKARPLSCPAWKRIPEYFEGYPQFKQEVFAAGPNHKVVDIRAGMPEAVYNFEVDTHHNYALGAGVFVHNCHPRDNIALSWLTKSLNMSADLCGAVMEMRERQTGWLADLVQDQCTETGLDPCIWGFAYKPETSLVTGSAALLLRELLVYRDLTPILKDPYVAQVDREWRPTQPYVFLIGCKHPKIWHPKWPVGSVVIDPHRYVNDVKGVKVIRLGE